MIEIPGIDTWMKREWFDTFKKKQNIRFQSVKF